jgi:3-oxoadipate enol-lactonase
VKISANGISINYEIQGKGESLILIHGAFDNLYMWYNQVPVFSKRYSVITYDIRGFGKTESRGTEYSVPVFVKDLYEFIKTLHIKKIVCIGFSLGGSIAVQLAVEHPELVKAIVLSNSSGGLPIAAAPSPKTLERGQEILKLLDKGDMKAAAEMMASAAFSPDFKPRNPAEFDKFVKSKLENDPHSLAQVMRSLRAGGAGHAPDITKLKSPTLLIIGEYDSGMGPESGRKLQQAIPNSKLVILRAGHSSPFEAPDEFNRAVLEFLSGLKDT